MRTLSREKITTYLGSVLPLMLVGGDEFNQDKITWSTDDKSIVQISRFSEKYTYGGEFTNGVLLTFLKTGQAKVTARYGRKAYVCEIEVREMKHAEPAKDLNYYIGDMHDHTYNKHKLVEFSARGPELCPGTCYMKNVFEEGQLDFGAVSDHSSCLNARDFYRGYSDAEPYGESVVFFPGSEGV